MERIWGGTKLSTHLNKEVGDVKNAGESWEISTVENNISVIINGSLKELLLTEAISQWPDEILGKSSIDKYGAEFPLLIKFLHSQDNLSIQVHPDDLTAKRRHNCLGKTEMWYIIDAEPNSKIINGFSITSSKNEFVANINNGSLLNGLNSSIVEKGDIYFIPTGRIHALGAGILVTEVQQRSDITYRIFDYNRTDANGKQRELHTELAIDVIDYNKVNPYEHQHYSKLTSPFFTVNKIEVSQPQNFNTTQRNSFTLLICVSGTGKIHYNHTSETITLGETLFLPAALTQYALSSSGSDFKLLEVFV